MLYDCKNRPYIIIANKRGKDIGGLTYKNLTYLYRVKRLDIEDKKHSYWLAECKCGNKTIIRSDYAFNPDYTSCGCLGIKNVKKALTLNLTGQRFGKLTALYQSDNKGQEVYWHCRCDCGNEKDIQRAALTSGATRSCGCVVSYQEERIKEILEKYDIKFIRQYRIKECKDKYPLPFDFALLSDGVVCGLIEYQGSEHFYRSRQWDTEETFEIRQNHDKIKQMYCEQHNIPLLLLDKHSNLEEQILSFYEKNGG